MLLYLASCVNFTSVYEPNLQFFSYSGSITARHLSGEASPARFSTSFPLTSTSTGPLILRWVVSVLFGAGIAAVAWTVTVRFGRSERRLMLALLIPMLPLGLVHAVVLPTPDLLGEAALAVFAVVLASAKKRDRSLFIGSDQLWHDDVAVLTLIHECRCRRGGSANTLEAGEIFHQISSVRNALGGFGHPSGHLASPRGVLRSEDRP
jgi:hypothetical protein